MKKLRPVFNPGEDRNSMPRLPQLAHGGTLRPVFNPGEDRNALGWVASQGWSSRLRPVFNPGEDRNPGKPVRGSAVGRLAAPGLQPGRGSQRR